MSDARTIPVEDLADERIAAYLERCVANHDRLCPRQVLGVRVALAGVDALDLAAPRTDKRLLVIVESDGCFVSGIEAVTGCCVAHRTLRTEDLGRIAATFIDVETETAVRVAPQVGVRERVGPWADGESRRYFAMLRAYQAMPDGELLHIERVRLVQPVAEIVSRPHVRVACDRCQEEVINEREVTRAGETLCRACAGEGYYRAES